MRTRARVRFKKQERVQRQAGARILATLSGDQRQILVLSSNGYAPGEIARELALDSEYVVNYMTGLIQRLMHDHVITSPEWRNVVTWAMDEQIIE